MFTRCPREVSSRSLPDNGSKVCGDRVYVPALPNRSRHRVHGKGFGNQLRKFGKKKEKPAALIVLTNPDILCLQEVWEAAYLDCLQLLPYRQLRSVSFQGGGLAILEHLRWLGKLKP